MCCSHDKHCLVLLHFGAELLVWTTAQFMNVVFEPQLDSEVQRVNEHLLVSALRAQRGSISTHRPFSTKKGFISAVWRQVKQRLFCRRNLRWLRQSHAVRFRFSENKDSGQTTWVKVQLRVKREKRLLLVWQKKRRALALLHFPLFDLWLAPPAVHLQPPLDSYSRSEIRLF